MNGTTPPKTSLLSQKLPGGQALILGIQQKLHHASSIRDLIIAMESKVNAGLISLVDLVTAMEEHNVFLDKRECDVLDRRFTNSSGDLEYFRLIKTLDIGTPAEHMDPEHFEDMLPQPYRMISKLLELEIMDVAWLEILRKHPEVAEDIPGGGGAGAARRNRNLDRECHPSCQTDKSKQMATMAGSDGDFSFSIDVEGNFQILDCSSGKVLRKLLLFHPEGQGVHEEAGAAPARKDGSLVQRVEMSNTSVAESPYYISRTAVLKIEANLPKPVPADDSALKKGSKPADKKVATPASGTESAPLMPFKCSVSIVETSGSTASSFEARVMNSFECMLQDSNVDVALSMDGRVLTISHGMELEFFKLVPITQIVDPLNVKSGITSARALLDIEDEDDDSMADSSSALHVVPPALNHWNIQEEIAKQSEKHFSSSGRSNSNEKQTHAELMSSMAGSRIWRSFVFPFLPSMQWNDKPPAVPVSAGPATTTAAAAASAVPAGAKKGTGAGAGAGSSGGGGAGAGGAKGAAAESTLNPLSLLPLAALPFQQQQKLSREFQNGLVVFFEDVKAFFVFGLRDMGSAERSAYEEKRQVAMEAAILAAGGSPEGVAAVEERLRSNSLDKGGSEQPSPLLNNNAPYLELITFWVLSDAVTAMDTDAQKSVLVLGQADGVVALWDLRSLQMVDVPTRHQSLVTAVALTSGAKVHSLVSGDTDGTLCFCNLAVPGGGSGGQSVSGHTANQGSASFVGLAEVQQCVKAELIDFRADFIPKEIIAKIISIPKTGIVIVQLASMKLVAYDAETAELYGRVSLTSGIPGQRITFSLVRAEDAVLVYASPTLSEEERERLLLQTEAEAEAEGAKGAGKGKKGGGGGGKDSSPAISPLEVADLAPPPETSAYLARKNLSGVCCASARGFCGSFIVDGREVVSMFSTQRLITFFCAGVDSILKHMARTHSSSFDHALPSAVDVYRALSKEERNNEHLKPSQVASLQVTGSGDDAGSATTSRHSASAALKKSSSKASTAATAANNNNLTEEKLKALQLAYSPFDSVSSLPDISTFLKQRVSVPKTLFEKNCKQSQSERSRRKKALLARMEALSGMV